MDTFRLYELDPDGLVKTTQLLGLNHTQHTTLVAYEGMLHLDMQTVQLRYIVGRPAAQLDSRKEAATVQTCHQHTCLKVYGGQKACTLMHRCCPLLRTG